MRIVVGAVLRDGAGRVLGARRTSPPGWEFPGGKVEPGETEAAALARELHEELGVTAEVGERIGPDVPMPTDRVLRVYAARVTAGEPARLEHAELRWFALADLDSVPWLPADLPIVAALRA
ncbi:MAG TPA: (deoxy)nucleoside triphosphate pyrophosphohydrolase [Mycobacteriales bacterium]